MLLDRWIADRDAEAFEVLVNRYAGSVYGACVRILGNTHAAEDVSQESFLKLADAVEDAPASLGAWLYTVATHRALNRLKSDKRRAVRERTYAETQPTAAAPSWDDIKSLVDEELARLPENQRSALVAHFMEGRTQSEIATEFEVTQQAISNRIKIGLETVREAIAKRGITLSVGVLTTLFANNLIQAAPPSLVASLGQIAIAGANGASIGAASVGATIQKGGMSLMLKLGLGTVLVAVAAIVATVPQPAEDLSPPSEIASTDSNLDRAVVPSAPTSATDVPQPLIVAQAPDAQGTAVPQQKTHRLARELRDPYAERDLPGWYEPDFTLASLERPIVRTSRRLPGRITDPDAVGQMAQLHFVNWHPWEVPVQNAVVSEQRIDKDGRFEFRNLPLGYFMLEVRGERSDAYDRVIILEQFQQPMLSSPMFPGRPTGGRTVNEQGDPVKGAILHLYTSVNIPQPYWHEFAAIAKITSDDEGLWYRSHIVGAKHRFYVEAEGYASKITDWIETGKTDHVVVLDHGGTIKCRIVDAVSNTGMPGAIVYVKGEYHFDYFGGWTDEDGYITLTDIRPGDYQLRLEDSRVAFDAPQPRITVARGKTVDAGTIEAVPAGIIQGRVVNSATGLGIAGIELTVTNRQRIDKENVVTDAEGYYEITGVSGGKNRIVRQRNAYFGPDNGRHSIQVVAVAGEIVEAQDYELTPGIPFQGRVTDSTGRGVPGAIVVAKMEGKVEERTYTDNSGRFSLKRFLEPGTVDIQAHGSGLSTVVLDDIDLPEHGRTDLAITLAKEASIEGNLLEPSGRATSPIAIFVQRRPEDGSPQFIEPPFNFSAVWHGRFLIANLAAGTYDIFMNRNLQQRQSGIAIGTVTLSEGQRVSGLNLTTQNSGVSISGAVFSSQGEEVHLAQVRANPLLGEAWQSSFAQTKADGTFLLEGLADEPYRVTVSHKNYSELVEEIRGGTQNKLLTLQGRGKISGRVIAAGGAPIERFQLYHVLGEQGYQTIYRNSFRGYSSDKGEFLLDRVNMGTNTVFARADGYATATLIIDDVRPGETMFNVTMELQAAPVLSGIVRDSNGVPVSGARIYGDRFYQRQTSNEYVFAKSDIEGRFQTDEIPPGEVIVVVRHDKFSPVDVALYIESGEHRELDFVLTRGGTIEGMVTLNGQTVADASVRYIPIDPTSGHPRNPIDTKTDSSGRYALEFLPTGAGSIRLTMSSDGTNQSYGEAALVLENEISIMDFDIHSGTASLSGRVMDEYDQPVSGRVSVNTGRISFSTQVGDDGYFDFTGLPAGLVALGVFAIDHPYPMKVVPVEITENSVIERDIVLRESYLLNCTFRNVPADSFRLHARLYAGHIEVQGLTTSEISRSYGYLSTSRFSGDPGAPVAMGIHRGHQYTLVAYTSRSGATADEIGALYPVARFIDVVIDGDMSVEVSF